MREVECTANQAQRCSVAVLIPTLNEERSLPETLRSLQDQSHPPDRVLICDFASTDGTVAVARHFGVEVVSCPLGGRGNQIARGLEHVREEIVVVAHADMLFPSDAMERICREFSQNPLCPGGCLGHRFDRSSMWLRWVERFDFWRAAKRGIAYGDQAQFFRTSWLQQVGGFPKQRLMEDIELSRRLKKLGRPVYLDCPVTVSARRFQELGLLRTLISNLTFRVVYALLGTQACEWLHRHYYRTGRGS